MAELILPQESYQLIGTLFETYNELGPISYQEKHFQKAVEVKLKQKNIPFKSQQEVKLNIGESKVGEFFIDLIVFEPPNQIIVELKRSQYITLADYRQINRYLETTGIKLGIIVNATRNGRLKYKRIINSKIDSST
jgi:GxxExxY protein